MWNVDYWFVLRNLTSKDFKIRYRNMSLGIFWSLCNPLIMMSVLTFIFTKIFPSPRPAFPVFILCGLVPFNFFTTTWVNGTNCLVDQAGLVKRVPLPRILLPIANVVSSCFHLMIQIGLLLSFTLAFGFPINRYWALLPLVWFFEIVFVLGLVMASSALDVYVRDVRYIVESATMVLFWMVPVFYSFDVIPQRYRDFYQFNPVAAIVLASRNILLDAAPPPSALLWKLGGSSIFICLIGYLIFERLHKRFYEHL